MRVKELIEELQAQSQEAEVLIDVESTDSVVVRRSVRVTTDIQNATGASLVLLTKDEQGVERWAR